MNILSSITQRITSCKKTLFKLQGSTQKCLHNLGNLATYHVIGVIMTDSWTTNLMLGKTSTNFRVYKTTLPTTKTNCKTVESATTYKHLGPEADYIL